MKKLNFIFLLSFFPLLMYSQSNIISGYILDSNKESMPGVLVSIKGTNTGVVSNADGFFSIVVDVDLGNFVLLFEFITFKRYEFAPAKWGNYEITLYKDKSIRVLNNVSGKHLFLSPGKILNPINVFWKTDPHTTKSNIATIKSIISGNDIKVDQIKVLVNGKSQNGQKLGETSLKANQNRYNWQGVVSLQEGENEIVLAIQQPNQAEVRSEPLIIRYEEPTKPNLYIVSVGVKGLGLKYTPNDAQKIADVFRTQKGKLFGQVNIGTYNQEQNTTAESLRNGIGELSSIGITPNDVLVVFVSAHGEKISKRDGKTDFAVLTSNFNSTNIFTKENTSLLYESHIIEYLKPIDCKKLILLDACHSGQATEQNIGGAKTRYLQDLQEAQEVVKRTPSGIITIASTSGELSSYEDDLWQNGAFTKALVDGLNGKADVNGDRYIYVDELFKYIEKTVPTIVNQVKKQRQEPKIYPIDLPTEKDFPIFKY